ncbi:MAG: N-acetylmuramoyl-L-alanine amidase, partial [Anaerolineae bacterium]|nr:N-acetylmuramoyl-L-alanine amidase [Anaerolineae bacterium]
MPRLLCDSEYLYGLHDPGGEHLMLGQNVPGWVLITVAIGHDPKDHSPGDDRTFWGDYRRLSDKGLGVIVRLNNGYGSAGTLPCQRDYDNFARRCANFVRNSQGAHIWIVGNEPNHPIEWPGADWDWNAVPPRPRSPDKEGEKITPHRYAEGYRRVREAIHALSGHEKDQVLIAAVAPWNNLTTYEGNPHGDWVQYFGDLLKRLGPEGCDGITLHSYTHGTDPRFIQSTEKLRDQRFQQYHWHFRAYQDFMQAIPANMRHLPVYITETDQGDDPWRDENTGWVRQAYQEVAAWNRAHEQQIRALILYRWPRVGNDKWYIEGKAGVIEDFKQALNERHRWGVEAAIDLEALRRQVEELWARVNELEPAIRRMAALSPEVTRLQPTLKALAAQAEQAAALRQPLDGLLARVEQLEAEIGLTPGGIVPQPPLQDVRTTLPVHPSQRWPTRPADAIRRIIVHHTVTRADVTPEIIAQAHVKRDKPGITYHFLVTGDGIIYWTQPLEAVVEQTLVSAVNDDGLAVALAGNFMEAVPTAAQMDSAARLIAWLLSSLRLSAEAVYGRNELDTRVSSPGTQWLQGA